MDIRTTSLWYSGRWQRQQRSLSIECVWPQVDVSFWIIFSCAIFGPIIFRFFSLCSFVLNRHLVLCDWGFAFVFEHFWTADENGGIWEWGWGWNQGEKGKEKSKNQTLNEIRSLSFIPHYKHTMRTALRGTGKGELWWWWSWRQRWWRRRRRWPMLIKWLLLSVYGTGAARGWLLLCLLKRGLLSKVLFWAQLGQRFFIHIFAQTKPTGHTHKWANTEFRKISFPFEAKSTFCATDPFCRWNIVLNIVFAMHIGRVFLWFFEFQNQL